jgi:hypothetical protein
MTNKRVRGQNPRKKQERLSLAPLTPEEALKRVLGARRDPQPESMVPQAKPKRKSRVRRSGVPREAQP